MVRPHRFVLSQMLKDSRDLFGEFEVHRVGRRTPQGHEDYRTTVHNINHARRHLALPLWLILVIELGAIARSVLRQPVRGR